METMTIQWSLVLFTALTGIGGWTFVCVAADEFLGRAKAAAFPAAVVAFALSAVGACFCDAPFAPRPHYGRAGAPYFGHLHRGRTGGLRVRVRGHLPGYAEARRV